MTTEPELVKRIEQLEEHIKELSERLENAMFCNRYFLRGNTFRGEVKIMKSLEIANHE
jgi:hypothetical protein